MKNKNILLFTLIILSSLKITGSNDATFAVTTKTKMSQALSYVKKTKNHLLSKDGAKDLALAYCVGMGLTAIHEFGHAVTAKILCGTPIDVTLGAMPGYSRSYAQIGGITLGGFNPATGYAMTEYHGNEPLKNIAILAAGPICGALSSLGAYLLLKRFEGLYITKAAALYGLFNHTLGVAGISGIWLRGSDAHQIMNSFKMYMARRGR